MSTLDSSSAPSEPRSLVLTPVRYDSDAAQQMVAEVQAEYVVRYGGPDDAPVDAEEFELPHGLFMIASVAEVCVGSVALRRSADRTGEGAGDSPSGDVVEIKRMYVRAAHRRRGYARRILRLAEERATALGYRRVVLETGTEQPEAVALYTAEGYSLIPGYGYYCAHERSRCFAKDLPPLGAPATGGA